MEHEFRTPHRAEKTNSVIDGINKPLNFFSEHFFIHGEFDSSISTEVIPALIREIEAKKKLKDGKIRFYIDSVGGFSSDLKNLLTLFEVAKAQGIVIETHVFARAYSCGSVLAAAGSSGHRYIGEHAEHLCHLGYGSTGWTRNDTELERESARVKSHFDWVRAAYKRYARVKNLDKVIHDDSLFIRGLDIIANGLADHVL